MGTLENYFKNECETIKFSLKNLSKHEIELLANEINNIGIEDSLSESLSGYFFNLLGFVVDRKKKHREAKKYFVKAIEKGNIHAMCYLGNYYCRIKQKYNKAKEYYSRAIKRGNSNAMNELACYYRNVKKNYNKAKKYYLMAIEKGNSDAMTNLGHYHYNVEKNWDEAKKYYLMAIEKNNSGAMNNLGFYYCNTKQNYGKAIKYYSMAIKNGNMNSHYNFKCCVEKCHNYKSFINCHVDLIKNKNFAFVKKLNKFVDKHFNDCINFIAENSDILQEHLNILEKVKFIKKNYCANCCKHIFLVKLNCGHYFCFACSQISIKCLLCKKLIY